MESTFGSLSSLGSSGAKCDLVLILMINSGAGFCLVGLLITGEFIQSEVRSILLEP